MQKPVLLLLAGLVVAASSYQMVADDSLAESDRSAARTEMEIITRNAAIVAFTNAKRAVQNAPDLQQLTNHHRRLEGDYEGALYEADIVSDGATVTIESRAAMANAIDTVAFTVSAEVAWEFVRQAGNPAKPYLVLRAYHEE